jgi:hypothetical protein
VFNFVFALNVIWKRHVEKLNNLIILIQNIETLNWWSQNLKVISKVSQTQEWKPNFCWNWGWLVEHMTRFHLRKNKMYSSPNLKLHFIT